MAGDVARVQEMFDQLLDASLQKGEWNWKKSRNWRGTPVSPNRWRTGTSPSGPSDCENNGFAFTDEELRPYFSLDRVLDGLFELCHRLFGISVKPADGNAPIWHNGRTVLRSLRRIAASTLPDSIWIPIPVRKTNAAERGWTTASYGR